MDVLYRHHSTWLFIQHFNNTLAGEEAIDILKLKTLGLGEEEEDDRHPGGVEDGENYIRLPANAVNCDRRNLNNHLIQRLGTQRLEQWHENVAYVVEDPVGGSGNG